MGVISIIYN